MATPRRVRCRWRSTTRCVPARCSAASWCCWKPSGAASPGARRCCATDRIGGAVRAGTDGARGSPLSSPPLFATDALVDQANLAFVFPGQGSQSPGMLADLAAREPIVRETFAEASEGAGVDLWTLSQEGPEEQLNRTEFTQPALLAAGVAVWRAWQQL